MPQKSAFEIIDIDHTDRHVIVEDRELGITIQVQFERKELIAVEIIEAYTILFSYQDGTSKKKVFLE